MEMIGDYDVKRITSSSVSDLVWLLQESYPNENYQLAQRLAKFDTGYLGVRDVGYIAYHKGIPAAFYGLFPCKMRWRDTTFLAAQSGDTVTHPTHRRKGLFYDLAKRTYGLAATLGIYMVFGLPNIHNSYPGLLKLEWQDLFPMQVYVAPRSRHGLKLLSRFRRRFKAARAEVVDPSKIDLDNANSHRGELFVDRSYEFFRYKQRTSNSLFMRFPSGDAWISVRKNSLFVGDFWPSSGNLAADLWCEILDEAQSLGLPQIYYHTTPNLPARGIVGKLASGLPVCVKSLLKRDLDPARITLTGADYDTF
jgi:GNAT superfamily N-acetyltransferase